MPTSDTTRDAEISDQITRASDAIMRYCDREFAPASTSVTRRFKVDRVPGAVIELAPYDLRTTSSVSLNPETSSPVALVATTDYLLEPLQSISGTYSRIRLAPASPIYSTVSVKFGYALVDVTGSWGFASVPASVAEACMRTVASWMDRAMQGYGGQDSQLGDPRMLYPGSVDSAYGIPSGALRLLAPWKRWVP